ncbi:MAG TPA: hypothetical protein VMW56_04335 [Candidatus Margulisiibacteriota bacterium]|nr:hypothetical protein [Candidatus Margulisiibacteriota bacterium]
MQADTRYAKSGGVNIAYQAAGKGNVDLVFVPGWVSHIVEHFVTGVRRGAEPDDPLRWAVATPFQ